MRVSKKVIYHLAIIIGGKSSSGPHGGGRGPFWRPGGVAAHFFPGKNLYCLGRENLPNDILTLIVRGNNCTFLSICYFFLDRGRGFHTFKRGILGKKIPKDRGRENRMRGVALGDVCGAKTPFKGRPGTGESEQRKLKNL